MSYERQDRTVYPDENLIAIVAALPSNSKVVLAPGTHNLAGGTVSISGKTNFSIEGMPGATLQTNAANLLIQIDGNSEDITLKNFRMNRTTGVAVGNFIALRPLAGNTVRRVRIIGLTAVGSGANIVNVNGAGGTCEDVIIRNCTMSGLFSQGINCFAPGSGIIISGCQFRSTVVAPAAQCIFIGTTDTIVSGCTCITGWERFIEIQGTSGVVISDNVIEGNAAMNIGIAVSFAGAFGIVIKNNVIRNINGAGTGIQLGGAGDCVCVGNEIRTVASVGIYVLGTRNVVAANKIYDPGTHGIQLGGATDCVIQGNEVYDAGTDGIHITSGSSRNAINGGLLDTCGGQGIDINATGGASTYNLINGVKIRNSTAQGILVAATCTYTTIEGCKITGGTVGIAVNSDYAQIVGNTVTGTSSHGISVDTGDYFQVNANQVQGAGGSGIIIGDTASSDNGQVNDNTVYGSTVDGIYMDDSDETVVDGNRCYGNGGYGINEDATCDQCLYGANHIRGNVTGASSFNGTNRTEAGNKT